MLKIVAFGNPLLDSIVLIQDDALLRKHNLKPDGQKEINETEMNLLKKDLTNFEMTLEAGGCAQNTLKVLQWLFQKSASVTIFGAVGNDLEGKLLKQLLKNQGVETHYLIHDKYPTGAAEVLHLDQVKNNTDLLSDLQNSNLVYFEGFFLTKRKEPAGFLLDYCKANSKDVAFNLSGEYLCREYHDIVKSFVLKADLIFGNRDEFDAFCSLMGETCDSFATNLAKNGKVIVITNGPKSVFCVSSSESFTYNVPVLEGDLVDTTGAGDSFVAGFLFGFLSKKNLKECVRFGCYAAQEIVKRRGCSTPEHPPLIN